jgi:hypothetical protein
MNPKATMFLGLAWLATSLAITTPTEAQTVTALADNRSGSIVTSAPFNPTDTQSYSITPRIAYTPVDIALVGQTGGSSAYLDVESSWLGIGPGNSTEGFFASIAMGVGLGANPGSCEAKDYVQISIGVSGVPDGEWVPFLLSGWLENVFSSGTVNLIGPGVNITYADNWEWNQNLQLTNGVYTLTINTSSSLNGVGPDAGSLHGLVMLKRMQVTPTNDECASAITITEGSTAISNVGATGVSAGPESCTGTTVPSIYNDVFYRYVATANGTAKVSTCGTVPFNSVLAAFTGSCANPVFVGCNDDACGTHAVMEFPTVCGETYTIVLGSVFPEETGEGSILLTQTGGCFPIDTCDHAFPVVQGDNNVANWYEWASDIVLPQSCGLGGDSTIHKGVFWTWTAPASGPVQVSTCGTLDVPVDSRLAVFAGSCADPQWIACNDNACGSLSALGFIATCGETYTIAIGSADGSVGAWTLNIFQQSPLCNDLCAGATQVSVGEHPVTTLGATGSTVTPAGCGSETPMVIANDVFFTYVAGLTGSATVSTCGLVNFDSRLGVFTGSCAAPNWIACNDDGDGCHSFSSKLTFETVVGQSYTIVLGNNPDYFGPGSGTLSITQEGFNPDVCEGAAPLSLGANAVSTIGMTGATMLPPECNEGFGVALYSSAFFTYEATADGIATIATCAPAPSFDTRLAAYSGSCGDLTLLACNDDGSACGIYAQLSFPTTCGERYVIELGSFDGQMGTATLQVTQTGACEPVCLGDLNLNGSVGADDLAILLGQWGGPGSADFNANGTVLSDDLAILLGAWGACP